MRRYVGVREKYFFCFFVFVFVHSLVADDLPVVALSILPLVSLCIDIIKTMGLTSNIGTLYLKYVYMHENRRRLKGRKPSLLV